MWPSFFFEKKKEAKKNRAILRIAHHVVSVGRVAVSRHFLCSCSEMALVIEHLKGVAEDGDFGFAAFGEHNAQDIKAIIEIRVFVVL